MRTNMYVILTDSPCAATGE